MVQNVLASPDSSARFRLQEYKVNSLRNVWTTIIAGNSDDIKNRVGRGRKSKCDNYNYCNRKSLTWKQKLFPRSIWNCQLSVMHFANCSLQSLLQLKKSDEWRDFHLFFDWHRLLSLFLFSLSPIDFLFFFFVFCFLAICWKSVFHFFPKHALY